MDKLTLRKNTIETLALLVDRYPNLTIAQILANAVGWDQNLDDEQMARALNQLFITYTQFTAAGIGP
jgi:hypothetical protein